MSKESLKVKVDITVGLSSWPKDKESYESTLQVYAKTMMQSFIDTLQTDNANIESYKGHVEIDYFKD